MQKYHIHAFALINQDNYNKLETISDIHRRNSITAEPQCRADGNVLTAAIFRIYLHQEMIIKYCK